MSKEEDREFILQTCEYKLRETLSYISCLESEQSISRATSEYLNENVLYVLKEIIQDELYKDTER